MLIVHNVNTHFTDILGILFVQKLGIILTPNIDTRFFSVVLSSDWSFSRSEVTGEGEGCADGEPPSRNSPPTDLHHHLSHNNPLLNKAVNVTCTLCHITICYYI